jgi:hypothetical protein
MQMSVKVPPMSTATRRLDKLRSSVTVDPAHRSGIATGRIGAPVAPRSLMQAPKKANS